MNGHIQIGNSLMFGRTSTEGEDDVENGGAAAAEGSSTMSDSSWSYWM